MYGPTVTAIEIPQLLLRPWQPDDLGELTQLLTDPEVIRYIVLNEPFPPEDPAEVSARTVEQWEHNGFGLWAAIEKATGRWSGGSASARSRTGQAPTRLRWAGSCTKSSGAEGLPLRVAGPPCATVSR